MSIEERIRLVAKGKVAVSITTRTRCAKGFTITASDGTKVTLPSKLVALQFLLAILRCAPVRTFTIKPETRRAQ